MEKLLVFLALGALCLSLFTTSAYNFAHSKEEISKPQFVLAALLLFTLGFSLSLVMKIVAMSIVLGLVFLYLVFKISKNVQWRKAFLADNKVRVRNVFEKHKFRDNCKAIKVVKKRALMYKQWLKVNAGVFILVPVFSIGMHFLGEYSQPMVNSIICVAGIILAIVFYIKSFWALLALSVIKKGDTRRKDLKWLNWGICAILSLMVPFSITGFKTMGVATILLVLGMVIFSVLNFKKIRTRINNFNSTSITKKTIINIMTKNLKLWSICLLVPLATTLAMGLIM